MKKVLKNLLRELYSDDTLLDCFDAMGDYEDENGKIETMGNVIDFLLYINNNIV